MTDKRLPLRQHLLELRKRVTLSVLAIVACTGVAFAFHQQLLTLLMEPAQGFTDIPNQKPIFTQMTEFIGAAMRVSLLVGLFASLPFVLYQVTMFVSPGLSSSERRYLYALLPACLLAFIAGAYFGYRILFPPAVGFLLSFGTDVATPYIRIGNYVSLMVSLLFWMGIIFETPLVLFFLSKIGVVTPNFLARNRRFAVVIAFILGAIITPTFDPINQSLVALPIIVMYELGIWMARLAAGKSKDTSPGLELETKP